MLLIPPGKVSKYWSVVSGPVVQWSFTPKGFRPEAQGCRFELPWDQVTFEASTPTGLRPPHLNLAPNREFRAAH